jgi:hypothetical protein
VVGGQQAGQVRVGGAVAVVVGPHGNHHGYIPVGPGGLGEVSEERRPLLFVPAAGEDLLELVDDQEQALLPSDCS